jgi:hypothetical protein
VDERRIRLAPCLGGTLWRLNAENGTFILFNNLLIATREPEQAAWTVIAPNWKVANARSGKVSVRHVGNLDVVVTLQGGADD